MNTLSTGLAQALQHNAQSLQNMINNRTATEIPAVHSPLETHMGELQAEINQLSHQIDQLEKALDHVLVPSYPEPPCGQETKEPASPRSNLTNGLIARRNEVQELYLKLSRLTVRIQL